MLRARATVATVFLLACSLLAGCSENEINKLKQKAEQAEKLLSNINDLSGKLLVKNRELAALEGLQPPRPEATKRLAAEIDSEQALLNSLRNEFADLWREINRELKELSEGNLKDALEWVKQNLPLLWEYYNKIHGSGLGALGIISQANGKLDALQELVASEAQTRQALAAALPDQKPALLSQLTELLAQHAAVGFNQEISAAQQAAAALGTLSPFPAVAGAVFPREVFSIQEGLPAPVSYLDDGVLAVGTQIVIQLPEGWWLGTPAELTSDTLELAVYGNYPGTSRITAVVLHEAVPAKPDDKIAVKLVDVHIGDRLGLAEGFVSVSPGRTVVHHFNVVAPPDRRPEGTLAVSSQTGRPGDLVPLDISIDAGIRGLSGVSLKLRIRSSQPGIPVPQPDLSRITLGPAFAGATFAANSPAPNELDLALVVGKPVDGPAVVLSLPFRIPPDAVPGTEYTAEIPAADAADFLGNPIAVKPTGGIITVQVMLGDLNLDGRITIVDVQLAVQGIAGAVQLSPVQRFAADVNRNGRPDIGDAIRILRAAVGLEKLTAQ